MTAAAGLVGADARAAVLRAHGADDGALGELLDYTRNEFDTADLPATYPLPDEPHVATWELYAAEARTVGAAECLVQRLVQLRFPVAAGMSGRADYLAATRRGVAPADGGSPTRFRDPDGLRLFVHPTPAGRIPVIVASARDDFVALVRALTRRNEPAPIPASMGACIVAGYNNWDRVAALRRAWEAGGPPDRSDAAWSAVFRQLIPRKDLYQDRFILLSSGPYSGVAARELGLEDEPWRAMSLRIRLEHECAHYFTRRVFGAMRNALLDEVIADYAGIRAAAARFRADWLLRFLGLEDGAHFRESGRLANYRGDPPLSPGAFAVLCSLVRSVARALEAFDRLRPAGAWSMAERADAFTALARLGIEGLAAAA